MREPGYYWVKVELLTHVDWIAVKWDASINRWRYGSGFIYEEGIVEINETRILNPDEVHDNEQKKKDRS